MDVEAVHEAAAVRYVVRGDLDFGTGPALAARVLWAAREHVRPVVVDLSGVTFLDGRGVTALLLVTTSLENEGREVAVEAPGGPVRRVLDLMGLSDRFDLGGTDGAAR